MVAVQSWKAVYILTGGQATTSHTIFCRTRIALERNTLHLDLIATILLHGVHVMRSLIVCTMATTLLCRMGSRALATASHANSAFVSPTARRRVLSSSPHLSSWTRSFPTRTQLCSSASPDTPEPMSRLYQEWTLEQDRLLFENRGESLPNLASLLGRGVRGLESRLAKLANVDSAAYKRLFTDGDNQEPTEKKKLVPAKQVLRRIQYDPMLTESDFCVLHYDRVEDVVKESPMDAPNHSVDSPETHFVLALPEHRVVAIKYKERIVWDRNKRIDRVFGNHENDINNVVATYEKWKEERDATKAWNRQRQAQVSERIQQSIGQDRFLALKEASANLQQTSQTALPKAEVETYVKSALRLFREARQDPMSCPEPSFVPQSDLEALDALSEMVALLPDSTLRPTILTEIVLQMNRLEGKKGRATTSSTQELPQLEETDLQETFVRGSGAGGQKINKTANRVVLLHKPTMLKVECQETRSLQQNRKIARKRLRLKLDEHLNGSESRTGMKANKARTKKAKTASRNKARRRRKQRQAASDNTNTEDL